MGWETRDLDIQIAKRVGFFIKHGTLYAPTGTLLGGDTRLHFKQVEATPDQEADIWRSYTPRFTQSVDEATWLVESSKDFAVFGMGYDRDEDGAGWWKATFLVKDSKQRVTHFTASNQIAAMAICEAWLKWQDTRP